MEFTYQILEHIVTLSTNEDVTKELNLISFNGKPPVYDLRRWKSGKMQKGITLTAEELEALKQAL